MASSSRAKPSKNRPSKPSRKGASEGLSRENRTLRMVGLCNQALLRAGDEAGLIQAICDITVEKGGYRMAWVGFAEEKDGAKVIRPVAHAGFAKGYLDKLNLTWDDTERGRGPTGTAIRTGKPSFIHNVQKDPRVAIWRKDALQQGFASLVSLPLSDKGKVFGALVLYDSQPDAFSKTEISLLNQLAGDLAFGITALRAAADHAKLEAELRRSEAKFRSLIEHSFDLITVMDRDATRLYESPSVERMLGFKPGERLDWKYEANAPEDRDKARDLVKKALAHPGVPIEGHLKVMRKDGRYIESDLVLTNLLGDSAVQGIVINSRDVTEKLRALNAVKESENQLSLILNNVSDVIFAVDVEGDDYRFAWVNRRFTDVTGVPKEKIIGVPVDKVVPAPAHAMVFGK
ncbi:MAG TPA: GAF domain-containing protein, partial [bacterium]|nr:GAF domain-containing protein [bacterium]